MFGCFPNPLCCCFFVFFFFFQIELLLPKVGLIILTQQIGLKSGPGRAEGIRLIAILDTATPSPASEECMRKVDNGKKNSRY